MLFAHSITPPSIPPHFRCIAANFSIYLSPHPPPSPVCLAQTVPGKTTVARLYYRLLKDVGVFAAAEEKAQEAKAAADALSKKQAAAKAAAAEQARQDAERRAFQSAGLPYNLRNTAASAAVNPPAPATSAAAAASPTSGFVETTGADLADKGVRGLKEILEKIKKAGGGVLFVDEVGGGVGVRRASFLRLLSRLA